MTPTVSFDSKLSGTRGPVLFGKSREKEWKRRYPFVCWTKEGNCPLEKPVFIYAYHPSLMMLKSATWNTRKGSHSKNGHQAVGSTYDSLQELHQWVSIKHTAASIKAADLEKKIDMEMKVREAAHSMVVQAPSDHSQQAVEAAKNVIVVEHKISAYKQELETRKLSYGMENSRKPSVSGLEPSRAKLAVSELRIPLIWRERDHFKNCGDSRQFAVFAVFQVGSDVCDTALIYGIDRTCTDVTFCDVPVFENVTPGFQVLMTLYSVLLDTSRIFSGSASLRLKYRLKGSLTRSLGHKWGSLLRKHTENNPASCKDVSFHAVATAVLSLKEAGTSVKTYDFLLLNQGDSNCPPLYGHFCCKLAVQPLSTIESLMEGILNVQLKGRCFQKLWCRIREGKLSCWRSKIEMMKLPPIIDISINHDCIMQIGRRATSLIVTVPAASGYAQYVLFAESEESLANWKNALEIQILDCKFWGNFGSTRLSLECGGLSPEKVHYLRNRCRNLYDEISLADDTFPKNSGGPQTKRPSVEKLEMMYSNSNLALTQENAYTSRATLAPSERVIMRKKHKDSSVGRKIRNRRSLSDIFFRNKDVTRL